MMERAISFMNNDNLRLFGIYHEPDDNVKNVGILFVHGGSQGRLGHTNQYVYYAREFARHGFPCLRFDPNGLGDSEGFIGEMERKNFYMSVETGRYVADVHSAINEFRRNGVDKIVLFGLCGGSITSLLAGSTRQEVCGMILLSCPVVTNESFSIDTTIITSELARKETIIYLNKLLSISALWKFLTFKTDYQRLFIRLRASVGLHKTVVNDSNSDKSAKSKGPRLNKYFFEAYDRCKNKSILWIFGSNDHFWFEFKKDVLNKLRSGKNDEIQLIENGNHMFTLPEWHQKISVLSLDWLSRLDYHNRLGSALRETTKRKFKQTVLYGYQLIS